MFTLSGGDIGYPSIYQLVAGRNERRDMAHDPPPEVVASWPAPNYAHPRTKGLTLVVVELLLIAIVFVVVLLRVYSRVYLRKTFGLDDWFILPATVGTLNSPRTCLLQQELKEVGDSRYFVLALQ